MSEYTDYNEYTKIITGLYDDYCEVIYMCNNFDIYRIHAFFINIIENYNYHIDDIDYSDTNDEDELSKKIIDDTEYEEMKLYIQSNFEQIRKKCKLMEDNTNTLITRYLSSNDVDKDDGENLGNEEKVTEKVKNSLIIESFKNQYKALKFYFADLQRELGKIKKLEEKKIKNANKNEVKFNVKLLTKSNTICELGLYDRYKIFFKNAHIINSSATEYTVLEEIEINEDFNRIYKNLVLKFNEFIGTEEDNFKNTIIFLENLEIILKKTFKEMGGLSAGGADGDEVKKVVTKVNDQEGGPAGEPEGEPIEGGPGAAPPEGKEGEPAGGKEGGPAGEPVEGGPAGAAPPEGKEGEPPPEGKEGEPARGKGAALPTIPPVEGGPGEPPPEGKEGEPPRGKGAALPTIPPVEGGAKNTYIIEKKPGEGNFTPIYENGIYKIDKDGNKTIKLMASVNAGHENLRVGGEAINKQFNVDITNVIPNTPQNKVLSTKDLKIKMEYTATCAVKMHLSCYMSLYKIDKAIENNPNKYNASVSVTYPPTVYDDQDSFFNGSNSQQIIKTILQAVNSEASKKSDKEFFQFTNLSEIFRNEFIEEMYLYIPPLSERVSPVYSFDTNLIPGDIFIDILKYPVHNNSANRAMIYCVGPYGHNNKKTNTKALFLDSIKKIGKNIANAIKEYNNSSTITKRFAKIDYVRISLISGGQWKHKEARTYEVAISLVEGINEIDVRDVIFNFPHVNGSDPILSNIEKQYSQEELDQIKSINKIEAATSKVGAFEEAFEHLKLAYTMNN